MSPGSAGGAGSLARQPAQPEYPGYFISFEGVDGVGKSTQVRRLERYLGSAGYDVLVTREPGGTAIGEQIRSILLHGEDESPRTEALLYAASRAQHVAQKIRPALDAGCMVISDRYIDSSLAYQAGGRELALEDVRSVNAWATGGLWPVRTYLLDMSFEDSKKRLSGEPDRLESSGSGFFERTRRAFLSLAEDEPDRFMVVDASMPADIVWEVIQADIDALLGGSITGKNALKGDARDGTGRDEAGR